MTQVELYQGMEDKYEELSLKEDKLQKELVKE